jgi:orotate phosphoribosyltransferase-like protein
MTELGNKIVELKKEGYTYNKIMKELNCSKSTISYYLGDNQKEKALKIYFFNLFAWKTK